MGTALAIRPALDAAELRRLARREADGRVSMRLLAIASALEGRSRKEAAEAAGMDRQRLRDRARRHGPAEAAGLGDPLHRRGGEGRRDRPRARAGLPLGAAAGGRR